jgi:hypothetical protein
MQGVSGYCGAMPWTACRGGGARVPGRWPRVSTTVWMTARVAAWVVLRPVLGRRSSGTAGRFASRSGGRLLSSVVGGTRVCNRWRLFVDKAGESERCCHLSGAVAGSYGAAHDRSGSSMGWAGSDRWCVSPASMPGHIAAALPLVRLGVLDAGGFAACQRSHFR